MATKKNTTPALVAFAEKAITPVIRDYVEWIEKETGYRPDERSVLLASALRGKFQKSPSNQKRLSDQAARVAKAKADRAAKAAAKAKP